MQGLYTVPFDHLDCHYFDALCAVLTSSVTCTADTPFDEHSVIEAIFRRVM